jgi:two-component system, chemotaxis family, sensor kinase CheA
MVDKTQAKALQDFAQEAEEILEGLAEDLEQVQEQFESDGKVKPDRINKIFREMHSLKGLASMFNLERITKLSHDLESLLDKIRLGKVKVNRSLFSLLNDSRVCLRNLVTEARQGEETTGIQELLKRITSEEAGPTIPTTDSLGGIRLDESTLKSLTEYEEHRLKENIEEENRIFAVKVSFDFTDFDTRLRALSERLSESGEVISTLPLMDPGASAGIHFRLIYGTRLTLEQVNALVGDWKGEVSDLLPGKGPAAAQVSAAEAAGEETPDKAQALQESEAEDVRGLTNTVKVDIEKLDTVMGIVGELNLVKVSLEQIAGRLHAQEGQAEMAAEVIKQVRSMGKKLGDLQRSIIDIRLVPIGQIFTRLNRTAKRLARQANKEVSVQLYGGETELDKMMIDALVTPLIHIIRNSIDHGLEAPGERIPSGKPSEGLLAISAYQKGNSIVLEVTDDGRGLQIEKIHAAAIKRGLIDPKQQLTPEECMELIFLPGFSSAETVTEVSGRGVGLDAVRAAIQGMKGSIAVWSEPSKGTTFQITLPITLAIIQSLIVGCCEQAFAIPISSIQETFRASEGEVQRLDQREVYNLRGVTLPLLRLEQRFSLKRATPKESDKLFVVVARRGEKSAGIIVDELLGEQETVVHPLGQRMGSIPGVAGATEVGENQVILVIDTASLFTALEQVRG